jgi:hypothetical protein
MMGAQVLARTGANELHCGSRRAQDWSASLALTLSAAPKLARELWLSMHCGLQLQ